MRRYLVVANQTLGGGHLVGKVRECLQYGPCGFHIVVPATPPRDHWTYTEGEAVAVARSRLAAAINRFCELGADADGEVGDPRPIDAIRDALRAGDFNAIIMSTLPPGASRWLRMDLPARRGRVRPIGHPPHRRARTGPAWTVMVDVDEI